MRTFIAFTKKEFLEQVRTNKLLILTLVFIFIGILNPLTALLTPWILEMFSESMEGSGVIIGEIEVTALDSWMQFYKNIPIAFIVFLLVQSSIFSKEYQKGTLTLVLTKGFERYKIIICKFMIILNKFLYYRSQQNLLEQFLYISLIVFLIKTIFCYCKIIPKFFNKLFIYNYFFF